MAFLVLSVDLILNVSCSHGGQINKPLHE